MTQRLLFLNHTAIGTLYLRENFRTSSFRYSPKDRRLDDFSFKNLSEKEKKAYLEKKWTKLIDNIRAELNIPFRKWD
jgi:hypothetical protein